VDAELEECDEGQWDSRELTQLIRLAYNWDGKVSGESSNFNVNVNVVCK